MIGNCSHLVEVQRSLAAGQWPHAVAAELLAHVEGCNRCTQEILIVQHLRTEKASAIAAATPAMPALVWWRAQLRRRNAALAQAGRPIAAAQLFALAIVAAAAIGIVATHWHAMLHGLAQVPVSSLLSALGSWGLAPLVLAGTLVAALSGLALYLSADRQ